MQSVRKDATLSSLTWEFSLEEYFSHPVICGHEYVKDVFSFKVTTKDFNICWEIFSLKDIVMHASPQVLWKFFLLYLIDWLYVFIAWRVFYFLA